MNDVDPLKEKTTVVTTRRRKVAERQMWEENLWGGLDGFYLGIHLCTHKGNSACPI